MTKDRKDFDINAYLARIRYSGSLKANARTLREIHIRHMKSVPFENLSVQNKQPIFLQEDFLFHKIVTRKRGGFCYELNTLFAALLRRLGFRVEMLSAGVWYPEKEKYGPEFDHMTLLVTLETPFLADVGYGYSFLEPLRLDKAGPQEQERGVFCIENEKDSLVMKRYSSRDSRWKPQYRFTLMPRRLSDYEEMCRYHQTSPDSPFTRKLFCTLAAPQGQVTLNNMSLITRSLDGRREERHLANRDELSRILKEHFGIKNQ